MACRSNAVQAAARLLRPLDADTVRARALDDRRGTVIREGLTFSLAAGLLRVTCWSVCHSRRGRVNQVDITIDGAVWRTCSERTARRLLARPRRPA